MLFIFCLVQLSSSDSQLFQRPTQPKDPFKSKTKNKIQTPPKHQHNMPHLVTNRRRRYSKTKFHPRLPHLDYEAFNFFVYLVGLPLLPSFPCPPLPLLPSFPWPPLFLFFSLLHLEYLIKNEFFQNLKPQTLPLPPYSTTTTNSPPTHHHHHHSHHHHHHHHHHHYHHHRRNPLLSWISIISPNL